MTSESKPETQSAARSSRELFDELTQIVGGLAHEMKNPLSTISLNLKLLGEDLGRFHDAEHERLSRRLARVQEEADRVQQILNDFLRYAGKFELAVQPVDLCDVVGQLRDFFAPQADAARVVFRTALPDGPLPCRVDPNLIKQALLNLLINAVQAMAEGGELLLRLIARDDQAVIEVTDTGPGIEPAALENIFRPYWSSKQGGSGLGLPTARRIAREHGGTLTVESEPGKGTRFVLTLPTKPES
jgi:signal transduction histidine kinase